MDEKVAKRSFADHRVVDALLKVVEDEYTQRFGTSLIPRKAGVGIKVTLSSATERGDHKKALGRLRGEFTTKTVGVIMRHP
jgi:hypothetical protein